MSYKYDANTQTYISNKINVNDRAFIDCNKIHVHHNRIPSSNSKKSKKDLRAKENLVIDNNINFVVYNKSIATKRDKNSFELIGNNFKKVTKEEKEWIFDQKKEVIYPFKDIGRFETNGSLKAYSIPNLYNENVIGTKNEESLFSNETFKDVEAQSLSDILSGDKSLQELNEDLTAYFGYGKRNFEIINTTKRFEKRGCFIDVIGTIAEIERDHITGEKEKGIFAYFLHGNKRKKSEKIENKNNILFSDKEDYFLDYADENHVKNEEIVKQSFSYSQALVNNSLSFRYNNTESDVFNKSNNLYYTSKIEEKIKPFIDKDNTYLSNPKNIETSDLFVTKSRYSLNSPEIINYYKSRSDSGILLNDGKNITDFSFDNGDKYSMAGKDIDYSFSNGFDSIAFLGEID